MSDVRLIVDGRRYGGWKTVRVTRSMECAAGTFDLGVTDRWGGQREPWAVRQEDSCRVEIDGVVVIDGYVDRRSISIAGESRDLAFSGRDRSAALTDCAVLLDKWTFRNATVYDIAKRVTRDLGIGVSIQSGLVLPKPVRKLVVSPGDTAFEVIDQAAKLSGVLAVADGAGGIVLTGAGSSRASPLIEGRNIKAASVDYDGAERFRRYVVLTQVGGTDEASGGATRIKAEAFDGAVHRTDRVLVIRPESGITTEYARRRADWEARIRAARSERVSVTVVGWRQPGGQLWPVNALTRVTAPSLDVSGEMLISQAEYSISDGGEVTQLQLVRSDAFTPEPQAAVKGTSGWAELATGGL